MANRYMLPVDPRSSPQLPVIYPWENDSFILLCHTLYTKAVDTGFTGTFQDFQTGLGSFMQLAADLKFYEGGYVVTPMVDFEQVLPTTNRILGNNVIVEKIPRYDTTNTAGGYTVIIG